MAYSYQIHSGGKLLFGRINVSVLCRSLCKSYTGRNLSSTHGCSTLPVGEDHVAVCGVLLEMVHMLLWMLLLLLLLAMLVVRHRYLRCKGRRAAATVAYAPCGAVVTRIQVGC